MFANCLYPSLPHSRPYPLLPTPPEGNVRSDFVTAFTNDIPDLILSPTYSPLFSLKTTAPRPYVPELANSIACSSFWALNRVKTGPKVSWSYSSSVPSTTVMGKNGFYMLDLCHETL